MHKKLLISSKGHQYNNNKTRTNASGSLLSAPTITTTTTTNQKSQQPVPTKKKIKKLKIVIKAKERTAEEIARDENWKKSLVETVKKLKPTFNDMDNHLPDAIAVGTICEYLSDDYYYLLLELYNPVKPGIHYYTCWIYIPILSLFIFHFFIHHLAKLLLLYTL